MLSLFYSLSPSLSSFFRFILSSHNPFSLFFSLSLSLSLTLSLFLSLSLSLSFSLQSLSLSLSLSFLFLSSSLSLPLSLTHSLSFLLFSSPLCRLSHFSNCPYLQLHLFFHFYNTTTYALLLYLLNLSIAFIFSILYHNYSN